MAKKRPPSVEEASLLDILVNPSDDTPRLVYADWLEDNGDPARAEFIRVQIENARLDPDDERRQILSERANALIESHGKRWCENVKQWAGVSWWFRRGFISGVAGPVGDFLAHASEMRRVVPLESADLRENVSARMKDITNGPVLAGLSHLALHDLDRRLGPGAIGILASCGYLASLRSLELDCERIRNTGLRALARAEGIGPLDCLYLESNFIGVRFGNEGLDLAPLVDSRHFQSLTALYLAGNQLAEESFALLGSFPNLRAVTIDFVGPENAKVIAGSPGVSSWRALQIKASSGQAEIVRNLLESPYLIGLIALDLSGAKFTDVSAKALADCPRLPSLRHLNLSVNHIRDAGALALASSPHLAGLTELDLRANKITRAGAEAMAAADGLHNLRLLEMRDNKIGPAGVAALRKRFGDCLRVDDDERPYQEWPWRRRWDLRGVEFRG